MAESVEHYESDLLISDLFIVCIFVFELKNLLKTLHIPTWGTKQPVSMQVKLRVHFKR